MTAEEILFCALETKYGIVVTSNRPETLKNQLYRQISLNPLFRDIGVTLKLNGEIWVVRKDAYDPAAQPQDTFNILDLEVNDEEIP